MKNFSIENIPASFESYFTINKIRFGLLTLKGAMGFDFRIFYGSVIIYLLLLLLFSLFLDEITLLVLLILPILIFLSNIFHEVGHYLVAKFSLLNVKYFHISNIFFNIVYIPVGVLGDRGIFGVTPWSQSLLLDSIGSIKVDGHKFYPLDKEYTDTEKDAGIEVARNCLTWTLIAGPLFNLFLAIISFSLFSLFNGGVISTILLLFGIVNLFNFLLTILTSDGIVLYYLHKDPKQYIDFSK